MDTVEQLFNLFELQKKLEHPSKCGLEIREFVHGNYGGYFYNRSKEDGLKCYEKVRAAVDQHVSPDASVILKCSCSEYEQELGPPADWEITDYQREIEDWLTQNVVIPDNVFSQPIMVQAWIMRRWLHHAYSVGDGTYKKFTNGEPLAREIKTYHEELSHGKMAE